METIHSDAIGSAGKKYTYAWMLSWMSKHPKVILAAIGIATIFFSAHIPNLEFRFSLYDLISPKLPDTRTYHRHLRLFESEEMLRIVIKHPNIYDPVVFNTIARLSAAVERLDGVIQVLSLSQVKKALESDRPLELERFKQITDEMEVFENYLISSRDNFTSILLMLAPRSDHFDVIGNINELLENEKLSGVAYLKGIPWDNYQFKQTVYRNLLLFPPLVLLLMGIILLFLLRKVAYVALIFTTIALSLIWALGLMGLFGVPLYPLSPVALAFLLSIQTAYGLHTATICLHGSKDAETSRKAVYMSFSRASRPFVLSITATLFCLLSFLFNPVVTINHFAILVFTGMFNFLFLMFTFFPLSLSLFPLSLITPDVDNGMKKKGIGHRIKSLGKNRCFRHYVLPVFVIVSIGGLLGFFRLDLNADLNRTIDLYGGHIEDTDNSTDAYVAAIPICVSLKAPRKNYFSTPTDVKVIQRLQRFLENLPGVGQTISFADYIKLNNYTANHFDPLQYRIPDTQEELERIAAYPSLISNWKARRLYVSSDLSETNILVLISGSAPAQLKQLQRIITTYAHGAAFHDFKVDVTGTAMALASSSTHLVDAEIKSLSIAMIMAFCILWFLLISFKAGMIAATPALFSIIVSFGAMGWLNLHLNMFTIPVAAICMGLAVVNVIHYIVCYHHELQKNPDHRKALKQAADAAGPPTFYGAIAIGIGFSLFCFSGFGPGLSFALTMMLAALTTSVANILLLPLFFHNVELVTIWDLLHLKLSKSPDNEIPLFKGLARHQIHSILLTGTLLKLSPGEVVFHKGDMSDTMYALVSGSLDIINFHQYEDCSGVHEIQKVVNRLKAGDVVGEMGFFRSTRRSATAVATEKSELLQINWQMIRHLQWLYPITAQKFFINLMGIICDRLEKMTDTLCDQSLVDDLTGLFNKKGFTQLLETETNRAQRYREELTLCLIGLDMQDKLSSTTANVTEVMIRTVCQMLSREIRRTDILSRIDATTFAMVAPKTSQSQAGILVKRLRQVLHRNLLGFGTPSLQIRFTATNLVPDSKETGTDLLERSLILLQNAQE